MPFPRTTALIGAALTAALLLTGCAAASAPAASETPANEAPVAGGTLRFGQLAAAAIFDPHYANNYAESIVASNIADKLTYQDPDTGEVHPWLAESWEVSEDLTTFTFVLRDGVTFSDGTVLDANSVKENFDLLGLGDESKGITAVVELFPGYVGSTVIDDNTVELTFDRPSAGVLTATSHFNAGILASSTLALTKEERGDFANLVGSGPFTIASFDPQVKTVLQKREDYAWAPPGLENDGGAAYLDEVEIFVIPEATSRAGALRAGELDAILDVQPTDETPLEAEGFALTTALVPGKNITLTLRPDKAPTDDLAVRKAIQIGWDRTGLGTTVLIPSYPIATSVVSANVAGYADFSDALAYDPEAAVELLEDAGWELGDDGIRQKDGQRLAVEFATSQAVVTTKSALEYVQQQLLDLGIEVTITVYPSADWSTARNTPALLNGIAYNQTRNDITVIDEVYSPLRSNRAFIPETDDAYEPIAEQLGLLNTTVEPEERDEFAYDAQELVLDTYALAIPLFTNGQVIASSPQVHGVGYDANARASFYGVWITPTE